MSWFNFALGSFPVQTTVQSSARGKGSLYRLHSEVVGALIPQIFFRKVPFPGQPGSRGT